MRHSYLYCLSLTKYLSDYNKEVTDEEIRSRTLFLCGGECEDLETAKTQALNKVRYKGGVMHEMEAVGIHADDEWREITITEEGKENG